MNFYLLIKTVGLGETVARHRLKVARFHRLAESMLRACVAALSGVFPSQTGG